MGTATGTCCTSVAREMTRIALATWRRPTVPMPHRSASPRGRAARFALSAWSPMRGAPVPRIPESATAQRSSSVGTGSSWASCPALRSRARTPILPWAPRVGIRLTHASPSPTAGCAARTKRTCVPACRASTRDRASAARSTPAGVHFRLSPTARPEAARIKTLSRCPFRSTERRGRHRKSAGISGRPARERPELRSGRHCPIEPGTLGRRLVNRRT